MMDIYDFIGFAKSQGFIVEYRAKIGESLIFDISRNANNRRPATRVDSRNSKIVWFVNDYDILDADLENLVNFYQSGLNERTNNIQRPQN